MIYNITDFNAEDHTIAYNLNITSNVVMYIVNGYQVRESGPLANSHYTICVSKELFRQLQKEQSSCCTVS